MLGRRRGCGKNAAHQRNNRPQGLKPRTDFHMIYAGSGRAALPRWCMCSGGACIRWCMHTVVRGVWCVRLWLFRNCRRSARPVRAFGKATVPFTVRYSFHFSGVCNCAQTRGLRQLRLVNVSGRSVVERSGWRVSWQLSPTRLLRMLSASLRGEFCGASEGEQQGLSTGSG
jgi:hypothetical protein